jgi:uncharacterized protein YfaS (alpha-2-macroglobulin family)
MMNAGLIFLVAFAVVGAGCASSGDEEGKKTTAASPGASAGSADAGSAAGPGTGKEKENPAGNGIPADKTTPASTGTEAAGPAATGEAASDSAQPEDEAVAGDEVYDPTPVENAVPFLEGTAQAGAAGSGEETGLSTAAAQVVPFAEGMDPFATLPAPEVPVLPPEDPRGDLVRLGPEPPPLPGEKEMPFPPERVVPPPAEVKTRPLAVLRHRPEGNVELADAITVTFNQPMVPLTSLQELDKLPVPMQIEPKPEGRFAWIGTDTVGFVPTYRLPFGNEFKVTIPAGTESKVGGRLAEKYEFTVSTPLPWLEWSSPADGAEEFKLEEPLLLSFNAAVDPAVVGKAAKLVGSDGKPVELLPPGRPEPDPKAVGRVKSAQEERNLQRTVLLKAAKPLEKATRYSLFLDRSLTSTEGPLPMGSEIRVSFTTFTPLKVKEITCSWNQEDCYPGAPISIEFNNSLKRAKDAVRWFRTDPPVEDLRVRIDGRHATLYGEFLPATKYKVEVLPGVPDVHGQVLEATADGKVRYGDAYPMLSMAGSTLSVIEGSQDHTLSVISMNLPEASLRMVKISESELADVIPEVFNWYRYEEGPATKKKAAVNRTLELGNQTNRYQRAEVDLDEALGKQGRGIVLVDLKARKSRGLFNGWNEYRQFELVQVTDLGITAALANQEVQVLVTSLADGKPVEGVAVKLVVEQGGKVLSKGVTDAQGLAWLPGPVGKDGTSQAGPFLLVAVRGDDVSFLRLTGTVDEGPWMSSYSYAQYNLNEPQLAATAYTERGLYRPAEEVTVSLVARLRTRGPSGDLVPLPESDRTAYWRVYDPRYNEAGVGETPISAFGTASFAFTPPKDAPLGTWSVNISIGGRALTTTFEVQEYRTPEYKAEVEWGAQGENILVRRKLEAVVKGNYFFGAPMAGAEVSWTLNRASSWYAPPGNDTFSFQDIDPNEDPYRGWYWDEPPAPTPNYVNSGAGKLDGQGRLVVPVTLDPGEIRRGPVSFTLEAEVIDVNRQSVAARSTLVAHRAERYVGVSVDRTVLAAGETLGVSAAVTRLDGTRYDQADVTIRLMRQTWIDEEVVQDSGDIAYESRIQEEEAGTCTIKAGKEPGRCELVVKLAGSYVVRAETRDLAGRPARSAVRTWVYGQEGMHFTSGASKKVQLVPDRKEYTPGETARLLITSPFPAARGLLVVAREGIAEVKAVDVTQGSIAFELPIQDAWLPGITVSVALVSGRTEPPGETAEDRGRPMFAGGSINIPITRDRRKLSLQLAPSATAVDPGGTFTLNLSAEDPDGKPVQGNVAVMVVDEGVLSLIGYLTPDVLSAMYTLLSPEVGFSDLRPMVVPRTRPRARMDSSMARDEGGDGLARGGFAGALEEKSAARPMAAAEPEAMPPAPGGPGGSGEAAPKFALREFFKSTAYFNGALKTGPDGKLSVDIKLPDNLTEFRVMAIAADEGRLFGSADSKVRTRLPLVVRPALPRFLNFGDRFEAAAVINNQTGFDTEVMVRCLASNATVAEPVQKVAVRHGEAREVHFTAATEQPGPATFQFAAMSLTEQRRTDAAQVTIPVLIPATAEAFATYGSTDGAVRQPLVPPENALPVFGGLDVSFSSTALTGLQDAARYLVEYEFECTEQLCSRILPILALGDILKDFKLGKASDPALARKLVEEGIDKILKRQQSDGGFGSWPGQSDTWLYMGAYAVMTLELAKSRGYEIPEDALARAREYLKYRLDHPHEWEEYSYDSQAMAVLVLARLGDTPVGHLDRLLKLAGKKWEYTWEFPFYAKAFLMEALFLTRPKDKKIDELYRTIANAGVETASAIHFSEGRSEGLKLMMHSDDRTDAIVLSALLAVRPDDSMIEKIVRGLMRARVDGRWSTTQANAYALLAMARYYEMFEKVTPDFTARLWLGDEALAAHKFKGREMTIATSRIPMKTILEKAAGDLIVARKGQGKLYYRLGLRYAPNDLKLNPEDRGFVVERTYLPEGKDGSLTRREDGAWVAKAGTYVRVMVRVVAPDRRYYVAVIDPLPAGLEAVNEAFKTSATQRLGDASTTVQEGRWNWWYYWYSPWTFEERRDDRVQLFADRMWDGVYEYTYTARATAVGTFQVPPARAEEMYEPETFGRTASETFVVEP